MTSTPTIRKFQRAAPFAMSERPRRDGEPGAEDDVDPFLPVAKDRQLDDLGDDDQRADRDRILQRPGSGSKNSAQGESTSQSPSAQLLQSSHWLGKRECGLRHVVTSEARMETCLGATGRPLNLSTGTGTTPRWWENCRRPIGMCACLHTRYGLRNFGFVLPKRGARTPVSPTKIPSGIDRWWDPRCVSGSRGEARGHRRQAIAPRREVPPMSRRPNREIRNPDSGPRQGRSQRRDGGSAAGDPGIGKSRALEIVRYRDKHGPFTSLDELDRVPHMGDMPWGELDQVKTASRVRIPGDTAPPTAPEQPKVDVNARTSRSCARSRASARAGAGDRRLREEKGASATSTSSTRCRISATSPRGSAGRSRRGCGCETGGGRSPDGAKRNQGPLSRD